MLYIYIYIEREREKDPEIILGMGSANERRRYIAKRSLTGWAHTQNNPEIRQWIYEEHTIPPTPPPPHPHPPPPTPTPTPPHPPPPTPPHPPPPTPPYGWAMVCLICEYIASSISHGIRPRYTVLVSSFRIVFTTMLYSTAIYREYMVFWVIVS